MTVVAVDAVTERPLADAEAWRGDVCCCPSARRFGGRAGDAHDSEILSRASELDAELASGHGAMILSFEQFLLDYLPRKVSLGLGTVAQLPAVLRAWVRFALTKRGLEERWIVETQRAVDRLANEFRRAMTDSKHFGPAKLLGNAILADGVDPLDQAAVDEWIREFNARPL